MPAVVPDRPGRGVHRHHPLRIPGPEPSTIADETSAATATPPTAIKALTRLGPLSVGIAACCRLRTSGHGLAEIGRLAEGSAEAHRSDSRVRVSEVLHVDDLAVPQPKNLRQAVPPSLLVSPGERDDNTATTGLHGVEVVVPSTEHPPVRQRLVESRTGLVGAVSGRRPEQPPQGASSAPLHGRVDQRNKRLDVALGQRLVRSANRINDHLGETTPNRTASPSSQPSRRGQWFSHPGGRRFESV